MEKSIKKLETDQEQTGSERDKAIQERDTLLAEQQKNMAEKGSADEHTQQLAAQRDKAQQELKQVTTENTCYVQQKYTFLLSE